MYQSPIFNVRVSRWNVFLFHYIRAQIKVSIRIDGFIYHTIFGKSVFHEQYIPRNMHTIFALLCFVVVKHWLIFPYPSGLLHWHCGNLTIAPVPATQPWWIWINISCGFIMNDCITTTKQSTTKPCAYILGYNVIYKHFDICSLDGIYKNVDLDTNNVNLIGLPPSILFRCYCW